MTRVALWVGRSGPGRASAGALVDPEGADAETVRRAVLACGTALAADRLAAAAITRALPRDPLHLGRTGAALRSIAREATLYPETLPGMAAGIAATARDPDAVRMFTDPDRGRPPDDDRRGMRLPDGRTATIAAAGALMAGAVGLGIAGLLVWWLDPATANRATALVAGAVIGALVGTAVAVRLVRGRN